MGDIQYRAICKYNENGALVDGKTYYSNDRLAAARHYEYDDKGNKIKSVLGTDYGNGQNSEFDVWNEMEFDANGNIICEVDCSNGLSFWTCNYEYQQELNTMDYDEIVAYDERYYLCRKSVKGFDVNQELYGIYDVENDVWAVEYMELDHKADRLTEFIGCGDGVFIYAYESYFSDISFISAKAGGVFTVKSCSSGLQNIKFVNGESLVFLNER